MSRHRRAMWGGVGTGMAAVSLVLLHAQFTAGNIGWAAANLLMAMMFSGLAASNFYKAFGEEE